MRDILGTSLIKNYNITITSPKIILFLHQEVEDYSLYLFIT
jgi:hypothetical protein